MSTQSWHKRYHSDALTGFMSLTLEERGAYQTILDLIYDRGGPIVDNDRLLAGYMGVSVRKWISVRDGLILKGKITREDGHISNARAVLEIKNALKTSRKHAENGSKGGRKGAENRKKGNENNGNDEAGLEAGSSLIRSYKLEEANASPHARAGENDFSITELSADLCRITGVPIPDPSINFDKHQAALKTVEGWIQAGAALPLIRETLTKRCAALRTSPRSLAFFDIPIREAIAAEREAGAALPTGVDRLLNDIKERKAHAA